MRRSDNLPANLGLFNTKSNALLASHQQLTSKLEETLGLIDELITLDQERENARTNSLTPNNRSSHS